jgi:uncharacterized protein with HEPN domain
MLSEKARLALSDIRYNIFVARGFLNGLTFDYFKQSIIHVYAVTRALEIISEAARRLPPSFRERHGDLPWKKIMGIGNILRHNYDDVLETFLWDAVHNSLGPLLAIVTAEMSIFEDDP